MIDMAQTPRLAGVLFDLYGTTVDIELDEDSPRLWEGLAAALSTSGAVVEPVSVRRQFQTILHDEAARGREGFLMEPVFRRLAVAFRFGDDIGRIGRLFRELSLRKLHLRPYVTPLFDSLHRSRVNIGIVSNTEALLTRFELERYPILQTADAIVLSSEVGVRKPEPEIFELALQRIGTLRSTTVFIGNDWNADVLGAQAAGLRTIYVDGRTDRPSTPGVIEAAPTLEAIVRALRAFGRQDTGS